MELVVPKWLDEVKGIDFSAEKEMLTDLEKWAIADGWTVSDGEELPDRLKWRTDVLLGQPSRERHLRIAVLPKAKRSPGALRIDASTHRIFDLLYQPRGKRWRLEAATVPLSDDLRKDGWELLMNFAFRK